MATDKQQHKEEKSALIRQALPPGTVLRSGIREYKVVEVLGAGGFGITYKVSANLLVYHVTVTSYFVIKEHFLKGCWRGNNKTSVLHAPTMEADMKQSHKDFIEEAKRLNELGQKTPNIVKVNEVFEANGTAYYVMEYLDGGDLLHYVNRYGPMPEEKAVRLIVIIAKAVALLHENRLLHLDIKPDNIVLKSDPETGRQIPVLIDFGIVKHFDKKGNPTSHLTAKGASEGYAPMEQYDEIQHFAPEIDVYALGATLYFLLTGKHPPRAFNIHSFNELRGNLPSGLDDRIVAALAASMQPSKFERTSNACLFVKSLNGEQITGNETEIFGHKADPKPRPDIRKYIVFFLAAFCLAAVLVFWLKGKEKPVVNPIEVIENDSVAVSVQKQESKETKPTNNAPADIAKSKGPDSSVKSSSIIPKVKTPDVKETKKPEETDEQKYTRAVSSNDVPVLEKLADKGYTKAYSKLAVLYLNDRKYDRAAIYAQKAYGAGTGRTEAVGVMEKLRLLGYYDDKELPDALK